MSLRPVTDNPLRLEALRETAVSYAETQGERASSMAIGRIGSYFDWITVPPRVQGAKRALRKLRARDYWARLAR